MDRMGAGTEKGDSDDLESEEGVSGVGVLTATCTGPCPSPGAFNRNCPRFCSAYRKSSVMYR